MFFRNLTIKYLKTNKERTIATIIGLMIAVAMIMTVSMLSESSKRIVSDTQKILDGNSEAVVKDINKQNVSDFKKNLKFETAAPFVEKNLYKLKDEKNSKKYVAEARLYYIDKKELEKDPNIYFGKIKDKDVKLKEGTVIVTENIKTSLQTKELESSILTATKLDGDASIKADIDKIKIDYITSGNRINYSAIFIVKDFEKENILNNEKNIGISLVFKNKSTALTDLTKILKANNLLKENEQIGNAENVDYNTYALLPYDKTSEDKINKVLWIVQIFLFVVIGAATILVIYNSFTISIAERRKDYGMLISVGASKKQIRKLVTFEAFIMATFGLLFGFLVGLVGIKILYIMLNKLMIGLINMGTEAEYMSGLKLKMVFNWPVILTTTVVTYIVTYLGILRPARKASKTSPIESIKGIDEIVIKPRKLRTSFISKKLLGVEGDLANKSLKRSKGKYRITILSLTVSVVIFLIVQNTLSVGTAEMANISPDVLNVADYVVSGFVSEAHKVSDGKLNIKNRDNDKYIEELNKTLDYVLEDKEYKKLNNANIIKINNNFALSYDNFDINEKEKNEYLKYIKDKRGLTNKNKASKEEEYIRKEREEREKFENENIDKKFSTKLIAAEGEILEKYLKKNNVELKDGEGILVGNFVKNTKDKYYNIKPIKGAKNNANIYIKEDIYDEENKKIKKEYVKFTDLKINKVIYDEDFPTLRNDSYQEDIGGIIVNKKTFMKIYKDHVSKEEELTKIYGKKINEYRYKLALENMSDEEKNNKEALEDLKDNMVIYYMPSINYLKLYNTKGVNKEDIEKFEDYMRDHKKKNDPEADIVIQEYFEDVGKIFASIRAVNTIIKILVYGFIVLIVLISVSNVFNTISTNIILRQREFANLKSMGMTKKQMRKMLDYESVLYGTKVIIYGVITSFGLMKILELLIKKDVSLQVNLSVKSILIAVFGVMIIIFTTMRYARSKIDDMNIIDVIKKGSM